MLLSCTSLCVNARHEWVCVTGLVAPLGHAPRRRRVAGDLGVGVDAGNAVVAADEQDGGRVAALRRTGEDVPSVWNLGDGPERLSYAATSFCAV